MNINSPFEDWRLLHLKQMAVSREIMELLAMAFEGGQMAERNKPVDVDELQMRMLKSAYVNGLKHGKEDEREACAKVLVDMFFPEDSDYHYIPDARGALKEAHVAIRSRGGNDQR